MAQIGTNSAAYVCGGVVGTNGAIPHLWQMRDRHFLQDTFVFQALSDINQLNARGV